MTRRADALEPFQDAPYSAAWRLSAAISPRPVVRVATVDAAGLPVNSYPGHRRVDSAAPVTPWAVYLAGEDRRFRLLCFDLDAKTPSAATAAGRDAATLTSLLQEAGLAVVVCRSGPSGGRHVWVGLAETVDAAIVASLARLARHVCPSLDIAPLSNPATGCVRPPGSPHRAGGCSTVLSGDLATLTHPAGTAAQVCSVVEALAAAVEDDGPGALPGTSGPLPVDAHGRLYLPGPRRDLPPASRSALDEDAACGDASAVLWRVLLGAAAAHWQHADIAALAEHAPGLEHVRSARVGSARSPRPVREARRVLARQWDKAVRYTAAHRRRPGGDPTFDARAGDNAAVVRTVQVRADAGRGRWTTGGGPADRRVLDALCLLALQAVTDTVEADIRRLALLCGIGRETARTALWRLAANGWITQTQPAQGIRAAHWTLTAEKIDPQKVIHISANQSRSQADPRPVGAGSAERTLLVTELTTRVQASAHDLFTHGRALGHAAGDVYARTTDQPQVLEDLTAATGHDEDDSGRAVVFDHQLLVTLTVTTTKIKSTPATDGPSAPSLSSWVEAPAP